MNAPSFDAQRAIYINARSLILKGLDLMDKAYQVGKYKGSKPVTPSATETIAGIMDSTQVTTTEQSQV
jgi:hypothetical protein